ncbi:MAG: 2-amino-4-oxopentanoate thiolase subunit OrtA [Actinomycetota bacterium]|nr:2-amino-4-oxopentanoate thiolase subunit OrtA [Actinomycetota bacterium]
MKLIKKGEWIQIHKIVLRAKERIANIPEETKKVAFESWLKGFLNSDANIGDKVEITTLTKRIVSGELVSVNPKYKYSFGDEYVPEILKIGIQVRGILKRGNKKNEERCKL